jgi:hypothetical protein
MGILKTHKEIPDARKGTTLLLNPIANSAIISKALSLKLKSNRQKKEELASGIALACVHVRLVMSL